MSLLAFIAQDRYARAYYNSTFLNPLAAVALVVLGTLVFSLPRRLAFLPFLVLVSFISSAQRISVAGLDFNLLRILVICAAFRMLFRGELKTMRWKGLDTALVVWAVVEAAAFCTLRNWGSSHIIYQMGQKFEALGLYFVVRGLVRDWRDAVSLAGVFAVISIPVAAFFAVEFSTGRNSFAVFGGVAPITYIREGRMRCSGAFAHPILAGGFYAALMPLAAAKFWAPKGRIFGALGVAAASLIVFTTSSSTSWGGAMAGYAAACCFKFRHKMKEIRWTVLVTLVALHFSMTMPVWHLLARIDLVGGSTGWHRYNLINQWVLRWREWGALGVLDTDHWGIQLFDVTNQYVLVSVTGGMASLLLFVTQIVLCFKYAGECIRATEHNRQLLALSYMLGVSMFVHIVNFIGVSYFAQMQFSWYLPVGMLCSLSECIKREPVPGKEPVDRPPELKAVPAPVVGRPERNPPPSRPSRARSLPGRPLV